MIQRSLRALWSEPAETLPDNRPWWDWAIATVAVPIAVLEGIYGPELEWPVLSVGVGVLCVLVILWRRTHPLAVLVIAFGSQTAIGLLTTAAGFEDQVPYSTSLLLLYPYSLARWARGRDVVIGLVFLMVTHFVREPLLGEDAATIIVGAGFLLLPAALGAAVRFRRTARAREQDEVRMREREQLARELHDTVAHHVSAIVIQAQAGRTIVMDDPQRAAEVFADIEAAAVRSLTEMRTVVSILRDNDGPELAPTPGVSDIARLIDNGTVATPVDLRIGEGLVDLDSATDIAVYRLVQESLTNVQRHANGVTRVDVRISREDDGVQVNVSDDGTNARHPSGSGYGLRGMAERVELLGGTFSAGPRPDGGWTVKACLPQNDSA
ncbi:MAG: sensor histidine kinase [Microthrixaceae bacterium]